MSARYSCFFSSSEMAPIKLWGGRIRHRCTTLGMPFSSSTDTRASPVPSSISACLVSKAGFARKDWAAAFTAFSSAGV